MCSGLDYVSSEQAISRVLSDVVIHLKPGIATRLLRLYPSRILSGQLKERDLFNLAPDGVYRAPRCYHRGRWALTLRHTADPPRRTPFHPYPVLRLVPGGLFSVALSLGLPLLRATERPALWSSDFPPCTLRYRATTLPALKILRFFPL